MKAHHLSLFFILLSLSSASKTTARKTSAVIQDSIVLRRILHQPLFPAGSAPAPGTEISSTPPTPPSPDSPVFPDPSQPFFPEVPSGGQTPDQNQQTAPPPPPAVLSSNASIPIPTATQPAKPAKKVAIAISVGIVTFGMLSGLAFLLYRHRAKKHHGETQKLVGRNSSEQFQEDSRLPPSSFLYIGTVEPSRRSVTEVNGGANVSPYHKLNSVKKSDRYRPSPELQPLPPLAKPLTLENSSSAVISFSSSSSDAESRGTAFYTPQGSVISNEESVYASVSRSVNGNLVTPARNEMNGGFNSVPRSKRTSPKTMILASSPEMKHIIPSIKQQQPPSPPAPPSPLSLPFQQPPGPVAERRETQEFAIAKRPKFSSPPPPPNMALLRSISNNSSRQITKVPVPPAPPPPPSLPPKAAVGLSIQRTVRSLEANVSPNPAKLSKKQEPGTPSAKNNPGSGTGKSMEDVNYKGASSSEKTDGDDMDSTKPKLKPLHWDKVRATSERATVWDQLKSSSFQ